MKPELKTNAHSIKTNVFPKSFLCNTLNMLGIFDEWLFVFILLLLCINVSHIVEMYV